MLIRQAPRYSGGLASLRNPKRGERVVNRTVDGDVLPDTTRSQMYWLPPVT